MTVMPLDKRTRRKKKKYKCLEAEAEAEPTTDKDKQNSRQRKLKLLYNTFAFVITRIVRMNQARLLTNDKKTYRQFNSLSKEIDPKIQRCCCCYDEAESSLFLTPRRNFLIIISRRIRDSYEKVLQLSSSLSENVCHLKITTTPRLSVNQQQVASGVFCSRCDSNSN